MTFYQLTTGCADQALESAPPGNLATTQYVTCVVLQSAQCKKEEKTLLPVWHFANADWGKNGLICVLIA